MSHRNLIIVVVSITILCRYRYSCYELPPKDGYLKLSSSHLLDSSSTPRDQANYHHYRRSDNLAVLSAGLHQARLNSIPKSDKYQGWKPIISSRSLQTKYDRDENQKLHSRYSNSIAAATTIEPSRSNVVESRATEKPSELVGRLNETTLQPSRTPIQLAKHKTIKEDDIMRMHYGPADETTVEKLSTSSETNVRQVDLDARNQYHSQYRDRLENDQSTRETPKNIYEIIDKNANSRPTFKPIAESKHETGSRHRNFDQVPTTEATAPSSIDPSWLDLYDAVYNEPDTENQEASAVENVSHENDIDHFRESKNWSQSEQRYYTRTESAKEMANEKGGKFLGKPIVIVEQPESEAFPYFTIEYYRKLFDNFGRYDRSLDDPRSNPSPSVVNQTEADRPIANNRTNEIDNDKCTSDQTTCKKKSSHKAHRRYRFDILKMIDVDMKDFVPKTLRSNIYFIEKLLAECFTELQDQHPSSIVCLKKITTKILDNAVQSEIVKLTDNVSLVKENVTSLAEQERSRSISVNTEWLPDILEKMIRLFSTHSLRVQLVNSQEDSKDQVEGRRLHHYRRVFPVIVGAYMILYSILIPLSFKFLLLLGGKTLLVSKLALLLAMMGSLKKYIGYADDYHAHAHSHYPPSYHHEPYYAPAPHYHRKTGTTKRRDHLILSKKIHRR